MYVFMENIENDPKIIPVTPSNLDPWAFYQLCFTMFCFFSHEAIFFFFFAIWHSKFDLK